MNGSQIKIQLRAGERKKFRLVRCFDIENNDWKSHLATIAAGYEHVFGEDGEQDWAGITGVPKLT